MDFITSKYALAAAGLILGAAGGSLVTRSLLKKKYEKIAQEEIDSVKEHYRIIRKEGPLSDPATAIKVVEGDESTEDDFDEPPTPSDGDLQKFVATMSELGYSAARDEYVNEKARLDDEVQTHISMESEHDIFDNRVPVDRKGQPQNRNRPYEVTFEDILNPSEEFENYESITVTYYADDSTMTDEHDELIPNTDDLVGDDLLSEFTPDEDDEEGTLYVRNEKRELHIEVIWKPGSYAEAMGFNAG